MTTAALILFGIAVTLVGAACELALLAVSRTRLTEAVTRRLRGAEEPLAWPVEVERELAVAAATTSLGIVLLGVAFPAVLAGESVLQLLLLLLLLAVPFALLSGYLLPRWITAGRAERVAGLLRPVLRPWGAVLRLVLPAPPPGARDFTALGREAAAVLPETTAEMTMVGGVMTFAQRPVRDVMTPRTEIVAVSEGDTVAEIGSVFAESGYSRLPVYRGGLDEIVGMIHAFDLFKLQPGDPVPVRPVTLTPASRSCGDLLVDMQRERRHLAVVLDEFGGTLGIVTLEDLLQALVGEIFDEDDAVRAQPEAIRPPLVEVDGGLDVRQVEEQLGASLPPGRATTVAGRLAELAGRIPVAGERLRLGELEVDVLQASPTRVERLVIRATVPTPVQVGQPRP